MFIDFYQIEHYLVYFITKELAYKTIQFDDWLIIDRIEDVLAGTSIPYNYDKSKF